MKITALLIACTLAACLTSCDNISESDRLQQVARHEVDTTATKPTEPQVDIFQPMQRHILVEDFTGQDCINCPNATELVAGLQRKYGSDIIIGVAIHSGPLGVKPQKNAEGLATDLGDVYYNYWNIEMQPYGVIDRSDGPLSTDWWTPKVDYDLFEDLESKQPKMAPVNLRVQAALGHDRRQGSVVITVAAVQEDIEGMLQVWLIENGINAYQRMPDGSTNRNYQHNHVLRAAINGTWGEAIALPQGQQQDFTYSLQVEPAYNPEQLAVVAFVYNFSDPRGVMQVVSQPVATTAQQE
ncbi:MAG: Omp28 family outer membrane lipoprotein [Prevotella sp.]|nr:Omp28 family outer membrane lipoprotein [Prevotella sp.]